jgi:hypothetical protein
VSRLRSDHGQFAAGVRSTHLAQQFKELIGVRPKRLARTYRFRRHCVRDQPAGPIDWGGWPLPVD